MEIMTLLLANIKRRKGSFISTVLLCILILCCLWTFSSLFVNYEKSIDEAMDDANIGQMMVIMEEHHLTDELMQKIEADENVGDLKIYQSFGYTCAKAKVGDHEDGNLHFFIPMREELKLFSENCKSHESVAQALQEGEIYLPLGLKSKFHCQVGDVYETELAREKVSFTIKGFVEEPISGAEAIGWKQVFLSEGDYEKYLAKSKEQEMQSPDMTLLYDLLYVYPAENCSLEGDDFRNTLNQNTGITDLAKGSITRVESKMFTTLMEQVVGGVMMAFSVILFVVVLIVMANSISNDIAYDYTNIGILKSQGFGSGKIRLILGLSYVFAEGIAAVLSLIPANIFLELVAELFVVNTGILPNTKLATGLCSGMLALIFMVSIFVLLGATRKIASISPMRAISGNKGEVHFSDRGMVEVYGQGFLARLAYRQISSGKKRYAGILVIVMILAFFMMTAAETSGMLTSRNCWDAMGMDYSDVTVTIHQKYEGDPEELFEQIKADAMDFGGYSRLYQTKNLYVTADGKQIMAVVKAYPEYITAISKGRTPMYDNEILLTEQSAKYLDKQVGDMVQITYGENMGEYMVCGIGQEMIDAGKCIVIPKNGMDKLRDDKMVFRVYNILMKDTTQAESYVAFLNEKYGADITAVYENLEDGATGYESIVAALRYFINVFATIFAIFVVSLACGKAFRQERRDIGIYKAMGMSSRTIRVSFAVRYALVAIIGCILGMLVSVLLSEKCMGLVLSTVGLSRVKLAFLPESFLMPVVVTGIVFFVFAYFASSKVKSVDVRELIQE